MAARRKVAGRRARVDAWVRVRDGARPAGQVVRPSARSMRALGRAVGLLPLVLFAGCAGSRVALPPNVGDASAPARAAPSAEAPAPGNGVGNEALSPILVRALASIDEASVARDLEIVAVPRQHQTHPAGLIAVAKHIEQTFAKAGLTVSRQPVRYGSYVADNVIGERVGTDPSRVVIVTAHYDAVSGTRGADDNATGVVGVLGIARALASVPTDATLRFVTFAFEEEGMIGSDAYVGSLDADARRRIVGVFNLEMIGYTDGSAGSQRYPKGIEAVAGNRKLPTKGDFLGAIVAPSDAPPIAALERARAYVPELRAEIIAIPRPMALLVPDLLRSDHGPFWLADIPAAMLGDTADFRSPHYHRPSDRPETIDRLFLARATKWGAAATAILAVSATPRP